MCVNVRSCRARRERKVQTVVRSLYHRNPPRFSEPQMRLLSFDHNNSTKHNINGIYVKLEDLIILNKDTIIQDGNLYLSRNRPACSKQNYKQNTHLRKIQTSLYDFSENFTNFLENFQVFPETFYKFSKKISFLF